MITRRHVTESARSEAQYSDCLAYRYSLTRVWAPKLQRLSIIMLNPSRATERDNDPTVERCQRRAQALGFGGFRVVNLFAWCETDPSRLRKAKAPIGPENDQVIRDAADWGDMLLAAWGVHGAHLNRGPEIARKLWDTGHRLHHLGLTKHGHPRHPLYVSYRVVPSLWHSS